MLWHTPELYPFLPDVMLNGAQACAVQKASYSHLASVGPAPLHWHAMPNLGCSGMWIPIGALSHSFNQYYSSQANFTQQVASASWNQGAQSNQAVFLNKGSSSNQTSQVPASASAIVSSASSIQGYPNNLSVSSASQNQGSESIENLSSAALNQGYPSNPLLSFAYWNQGSEPNEIVSSAALNQGYSSNPIVSPASCSQGSEIVKVVSSASLNHGYPNNQTSSAVLTDSWNPVSPIHPMSQDVSSISWKPGSSSNQMNPAVTSIIGNRGSPNSHNNQAVTQSGQHSLEEPGGLLPDVECIDLADITVDATLSISKVMHSKKQQFQKCAVEKHPVGYEGQSTNGVRKKGQQHSLQQNNSRTSVKAKKPSRVRKRAQKQSHPGNLVSDNEPCLSSFPDNAQEPINTNQTNLAESPVIVQSYTQPRTSVRTQKCRLKTPLNSQQDSTAVAPPTEQQSMSRTPSMAQQQTIPGTAVKQQRERKKQPNACQKKKSSRTSSKTQLQQIAETSGTTTQLPRPSRTRVKTGKRQLANKCANQGQVQATVKAGHSCNAGSSRTSKVNINKQRKSSKKIPKMIVEDSDVIMLDASPSSTELCVCGRHDDDTDIMKDEADVLCVSNEYSDDGLIYVGDGMYAFKSRKVSHGDRVNDQIEVCGSNDPVKDTSDGVHTSDSRVLAVSSGTSSNIGKIDEGSSNFVYNSVDDQGREVEIYVCADSAEEEYYEGTDDSGKIYCDSDYGLETEQVYDLQQAITVSSQKL
jgi:hypothetical protein